MKQSSLSDAVSDGTVINQAVQPVHVAARKVFKRDLRPVAGPNRWLLNAYIRKYPEKSSNCSTVANIIKVASVVAVVWVAFIDKGLTAVSQTLKVRLQDDMKTAMKAAEKERLQTIRLILAAVKQREVDERILLDDAQIVAIIEKMVKQRRESIAQYDAAARQDLADKERAELTLLQVYLPEQLSPDELKALVAAAIAESGATSVKDMGRVMAILKPKLAGRAEMGPVGEMVKNLL